MGPVHLTTLIQSIDDASLRRLRPSPRLLQRSTVLTYDRRRGWSYREASLIERIACCSRLLQDMFYPDSSPSWISNNIGKHLTLDCPSEQGLEMIQFINFFFEGIKTEEKKSFRGIVGQNYSKTISDSLEIVLEDEYLIFKERANWLGKWVTKLSIDLLTILEEGEESVQSLAKDYWKLVSVESKFLQQQIINSSERAISAKQKEELLLDVKAIKRKIKFLLRILGGTPTSDPPPLLEGANPLENRVVVKKKKSQIDFKIEKTRGILNGGLDHCYLNSALQICMNSPKFLTNLNESSTTKVSNALKLVTYLYSQEIKVDEESLLLAVMNLKKSLIEPLRDSQQSNDGICFHSEHAGQFIQSVFNKISFPSEEHIVNEAIHLNSRKEITAGNGELDVVLRGKEPEFPKALPPPVKPKIDEMAATFYLEWPKSSKPTQPEININLNSISSFLSALKAHFLAGTIFQFIKETLLQWISLVVPPVDKFELSDLIRAENNREALNRKLFPEKPLDSPRLILIDLKKKGEDTWGKVLVKPEEIISFSNPNQPEKEPISYRLVGLVVHSGSNSKGHFVSHVRDQQNNLIDIDDFQVSPSQAWPEDGHIFLYELCDSPVSPKINPIRTPRIRPIIPAGITMIVNKIAPPIIACFSLSFLTKVVNRVFTEPLKVLAKLYPTEAPTNKEP